MTIKRAARSAVLTLLVRLCVHLAGTLGGGTSTGRVLCIKLLSEVSNHLGKVDVYVVAYAEL
jgi:hypothetical protein